MHKISVCEPRSPICIGKACSAMSTRLFALATLMVFEWEPRYTYTCERVCMIRERFARFAHWDDAHFSFLT